MTSCDPRVRFIKLLSPFTSPVRAWATLVYGRKIGNVKLPLKTNVKQIA